MEALLKPFRKATGQVIKGLDRMMQPEKPELTEERRLELVDASEKLKLYQFEFCPFCVKTRRAIQRLGMEIETRNANTDEKWHRDLVEEGGSYQVPCLQISNPDGSVEWMYESSSIIRYLNEKFG
ncbi:MAG: glutaredoxin [Gammaproteobacteria bacterium]|jgi:glutaredoxin